MDDAEPTKAARPVWRTRLEVDITLHDQPEDQELTACIVRNNDYFEFVRQDEEPILPWQGGGLTVVNQFAERMRKVANALEIPLVFTEDLKLAMIEMQKEATEPP